MAARHEARVVRQASFPASSTDDPYITFVSFLDLNISTPRMVREVKSQYRAHRDVGLAAAAAKSKSSKLPRSNRHDPGSSRAPVSAPEPSSSSKDNDAPSAKEAQLDAIHASLTALGAPPVSRDDLARLYQGPFGEALGFFVEHVVGREEARRARRGIAAHVSR